MVKVQRIIVPDTQERCWVLADANQPLIAPNQYLLYLHHLGRSPNTVRAYAHHLQAFSKFLCEENQEWTTLSLTELAKFVDLVASSQFRWQQITIRRNDQHNPRCGWLLLRISGPAWGCDKYQPVAWVRSKEFIQAVLAPH